MTRHVRLFAASLSALVFVAACGRGPEVEARPEEPTVEPAAPGEETTAMIPASAPVYTGVWAADASWCGVAPGSADPSPIAFAEGEFIGYENRCRVAEEREGTEGGYQLDLYCESEGAEYQETIEVDVDGSMLRMRRDGLDELLFFRCEEDNAE